MPESKSNLKATKGKSLKNEPMEENQNPIEKFENESIKKHSNLLQKIAKK